MKNWPLSQIYNSCGTSRSGKETTMTAKTNRVSKARFQSDREGIQIIKVAAFCFAIISWLATAQGLHQYVFSYEWQAYLVSFGIQSILFVFNLKLPAYFRQIGEKTPEANRVHRKYHWPGKWGKEKESFRWTLMQRVIAIFYITVLLSSSLFSFVFICDLVVYHHQSGYADDDTILSASYRRILDEVEDYARECSNAMLLLASNQTTQLASFNNWSSSPLITKEDLEEKARLAKVAWDKAEADYTAAKEKEQAAKKMRDDLFDARYWKSKEFNQAHNEWLQAQKDVKDADNFRLEQKSLYEKAQTSVEQYQPSFHESVASLLVKLLGNDPEPTNLKQCIENLNEIVVTIGENGRAPANFSSIVQSTQSLSVTVDGIIRLRDASNCISTLREQQQSTEVPDPKSGNFSEQEAAWKQLWSEHFSLLEDLIQNMPSFPESSLTSLEKDALDVDLLKNYDQEELLDEIDNLVRIKLSDINIIERSFGLLVGRYRFTALFSALFALFLDICSLLAGLFAYSISTKSSGKPNLSPPTDSATTISSLQDTPEAALSGASHSR